MSERNKPDDRNTKHVSDGNFARDDRKEETRGVSTKSVLNGQLHYRLSNYHCCVSIMYEATIGLEYFYVL